VEAIDRSKHVELVDWSGAPDWSRYPACPLNRRLMAVELSDQVYFALLVT
jgi:hypothetical protein